jgi:hypothetical protein
MNDDKRQVVLSKHARLFWPNPNLFMPPHRMRLTRFGAWTESGHRSGGVTPGAAANGFSTSATAASVVWV